MPTEERTNETADTNRLNVVWTGAGQPPQRAGQELPARLERDQRAGHPTLARGLGLFSVGIGLAEIAAPAGVARLIGVGDDRIIRGLLRVMGARELAAGVGVLSGRRPSTWLWGRVAGDALDLALLGAAFGGSRNRRARLAVATAAVAGVTAMDVLAARTAPRSRWQPARRIEVGAAVTVKGEPDELYRHWRSLGNLPRFMRHIESIHVLDEKRSRWRARGPADLSIEWDAEITDERSGSLLAWRSVEGSTVPNDGRVRFVRAPGGRGTEVHVELRFDPPGGAVGRALSRLFGKVPAAVLQADLRRFKQIIEVGEVVRSDASVHRGPHPARPSAAGRKEDTP